MAESNEEQESFDWVGLIQTAVPPLLYVGLPILAYTQVIDPLLTSVNVFESEEEQQKKKEKNRKVDNSNFPDNSSPSISKGEAQTIADTQLQAMNTLGTNFPKLKQSLQGLNGADLVLVFRAFGNKYYNTVSGVLDQPNMLNSSFVRYLNLHGWYHQELDQENLNIIRKIWRKSGLKF
jgi:hypothetical protein